MKRFISGRESHLDNWLSIDRDRETNAPFPLCGVRRRVGPLAQSVVGVVTGCREDSFLADISHRKETYRMYTKNTLRDEARRRYGSKTAVANFASTAFSRCESAEFEISSFVANWSRLVSRGDS